MRRENLRENKQQRGCARIIIDRINPALRRYREMTISATVFSDLELPGWCGSAVTLDRVQIADDNDRESR